ncbi:hypothetical protein N7488_004804 [Penicillium malachiteum]|nr:hypothetical protein N7488_004804 [Penicillium malachiteum]
MARKLDEKELLTLSVSELQELLIEKHNLSGFKLRAILFTVPRDIALARAQKLDDDRASGNILGPLHGIPIIVKDAYATHPDLGMPTTAGSFALLGSRPKRNAVVVDRLLDAGMIILGKTSMTEFSNYKDSKTYPGWTPIGGQSQSAYVVGGIQKGDYKLGDSSPGGSSTGVAVGISAGFSPLGIGTETDGSLNTPASRAALFALKLTVGSASGEGIISISSTFDSLGGMGKTVKDVALLTDVLLNPEPRKKFPPKGLSEFLVNNWKDIKVGFVDASYWQLPPGLFVSDDEYKAQMKTALEDAATQIASYGATVINPVDLIPASCLKFGDEPAMPIIMRHEFHQLINDYLANFLEESKVRSLKDLVQFNLEHSSDELPIECPGQDLLLNSLEDKTSFEKVEGARVAVKEIAKNGIDKVFDDHGIEAIIAPTDSPISSLASAAGYPIATVPLGRRTTNGRPFGASILARSNHEHILIKIMSAWEATFPKREIPTLFLNDSSRL